MLVNVADTRSDIVEAVEAERIRQDNIWGTAFDDANTANDWAKYVADYGLAAAGLQFDREHFRKKMVQAAALAMAAIEALDRGGPAPRHYD